MGSVDRPHKRIGTSPSLPSDDQSPVTSSGTNVSNDESSSSQPPCKNHSVLVSNLVYIQCTINILILLAQVG